MSDNEALPTAGSQLTSFPTHRFRSLHLPSEPSPAPPPVRPGGSKLWGYLLYSLKHSVQIQLVCGDVFCHQLRTCIPCFACSVINSNFFLHSGQQKMKPITNREDIFRPFSCKQDSWAWMRDLLWLQSKPIRTPTSASHPGKYRHRRGGGGSSSFS